MSAQVGIAGSTKVGQWCMFGGLSGYRWAYQHWRQGVRAQSGVPR